MIGSSAKTLARPLQPPPVSLSAEESARLFLMLQTMLASGIPVTRALDGLRDQAPWALPLQRTLTALEAGHGLARAFALGGFSDPMLLGLLQLGERTGTLESSVGRLAELFTWRARVQAELRAKLTYPLILSLACALFVGLGPPFLLRPILDFISATGTVLPWTTRLLMAGLEVLSSPWLWLTLAASLGLLVGFVRATQARWRGAFEARVLSWPGIGRCWARLVSLRFGKALNAALASGYPLLGAIDLAARCAGSERLERVGQRVVQSMVAGQTPEQAFAELNSLDPLLARGVPLGLSLGQVEPILNACLAIQEQSLQSEIASLLSLLEPFLLSLMGALVTLCILATVSPMLALLQGVA